MSSSPILQPSTLEGVTSSHLHSNSATHDQATNSPGDGRNTTTLGIGSPRMIYAGGLYGP